jgi:hypothetical protein
VTQIAARRSPFRNLGSATKRVGRIFVFLDPHRSWRRSRSLIIVLSRPQKASAFRVVLDNFSIHTAAASSTSVEIEIGAQNASIAVSKAAIASSTPGRPAPCFIWMFSTDKARTKTLG